MVPFHLQIELQSQTTTLMVEQLDPLADATGFMRYHVRSFHRGGVVFVNIEEGSLPAEEPVGYSLDDVFMFDEVISIAVAIREYNSGRKLTFDQMAFDF
jgi:hypothetical protein